MMKSVLLLIKTIWNLANSWTKTIFILSSIWFIGSMIAYILSTLYPTDMECDKNTFLTIPNLMTLSRVVFNIVICSLMQLPQLSKIQKFEHNSKNDITLLNEMNFDLIKINGEYTLQYFLILLLFIMSDITDSVDGTVARNIGCMTKWGTELDHIIADPIGPMLGYFVLYFLACFYDNIWISKKMANTVTATGNQLTSNNDTHSSNLKLNKKNVKMFFFNVVFLRNFMLNRDDNVAFDYLQKRFGWWVFGICPSSLVHYYCIMCYIICTNSYHVKQWIKQGLLTVQPFAQGYLNPQSSNICKTIGKIVVWIVVINLATMFICFHAREAIRGQWFLF